MKVEIEKIDKTTQPKAGSWIRLIKLINLTEANKEKQIKNTKYQY